MQRQTRRHPNEDRVFEFTLLEHDVESGPMPFDDGSFDLVVFWGCFEHLRNDPEFALFEVNRVCAPGAVISLVTDNAISFQATHSVLRGSPMPMRLHDPASEGHWRLYTPMEIAELLRGTGWRVDLLTSIVPDPPVYWRWWKKALFKKVVSDLRRGFGMAEPFWNAFILVHATKSSQPTRAYPSWLYKDEKIRELKMHMMEMLEDQASLSRSA
jgi:SAM-dependent methyltransferase